MINIAPRTLLQLYISDYRVRKYILQEYQRLCVGRDDELARTMAFQLALFCSIGFGAARDDVKCNHYLQKSGRRFGDLEEELERQTRGVPLLLVYRGEFTRLYNDGYTTSVVLGPHYRQLGILDEALTAIRQEAKDAAWSLGDLHKITFRLEGALANILTELGRFAEATVLYEAVMDKREIEQGHDHSDMPLAMKSTADSYYREGRLGEAHVLYLLAKEAAYDLLGEDHINTLHILNSLAIIETNGGRYDYSMRLLKRVIEVQLEKRGLEHVSTLGPKLNLGSVYMKTGRFAEAETEFRQVWLLGEKLLGPLDGLVIKAIRSTADTYVGTSKYDEAIPLYQKALTRCNNAFGEDNVETFITKFNLSRAYLNSDRFNEGSRLLNESLKHFEQVLGPSHPNTQSALIMSAWVDTRQEQWSEAESKYLRVIACHHSHSYHPLFKKAKKGLEIVQTRKNAPLGLN